MDRGDDGQRDGGRPGDVPRGGHERLPQQADPSGAAGGRDRVGARSSRRAPPMAETLDPAVLAELLEAVGDDPAFIDQLVDTFLAEAPRYLAAIDDGRRGGRRRRASSSRPTPSRATRPRSARPSSPRSHARLEERARRGETDGAPPTRPPCGTSSPASSRPSTSRARTVDGVSAEPLVRTPGGGQAARRPVRCAVRAAATRAGSSSSTTASLNRQTLGRLLGGLGHEVIEADERAGGAGPAGRRRAPASTSSCSTS